MYQLTMPSPKHKSIFSAFTGKLMFCISIALIVTLAGCSEQTRPNQKQDYQKESDNSEPSTTEVIVQSEPSDRIEPPVQNNSNTKNDEESALSANSNGSAELDGLFAATTRQRPETNTRELNSRIAPTHPNKPSYSAGNLQYIQQANPLEGEKYADLVENTIKRVIDDPVSTFSIDVDTGAYTNIRRMLNSGHLPPSNAIRVEELINYFDYGYDTPSETSIPFNLITELAPNPWRDNSYLVHIGLKGFEAEAENRPASNLVFLIDVSGSMQSHDKLELLKPAMKMLSRQLDSNDRVSIVVYAGAAGAVLKPTAGNELREIERAIDQLSAGGSTNGGAGIELAYALAEESFLKEGINRVILATDGDFNVGQFNQKTLKKMIENKRKTGIELTTLGFGRGNYNDSLMEQLANIGNGNYFYIDNLNEARKVLVEELSATLLTSASDVKIQVEFNPAKVSEYRLIGYENRKLRREDFNNDKIDAGEIGAGHTVTALYEITLVGQAGMIDPLRYQNETGDQQRTQSDELAFLKLRFKRPGQPKSELISQTIELDQVKSDLNRTSEAFRFSAAVAGFGQRLRNSNYVNSFTYDDALSLARSAKGNDPHGYRSEFIQLVQLAATLDNQSIKLSQRQ